MSEKMSKASQGENMEQARERRKQERRTWESEHVGKAWAECRVIVDEMRFQDAQSLEQIEKIKKVAMAEWLKYTLATYGYPPDAGEIAVQPERTIGFGSEGSFIGGGLPQQTVDTGSPVWVKLKDVEDEIDFSFGQALFYGRGGLYVTPEGSGRGSIVHNPTVEYGRSWQAEQEKK